MRLDRCLPLVINVIGSVGGVISMRRYNLGLVTGTIFLLPLGGFALYAIQQAGDAPWMHIIGAGSSIAIHAAIGVIARVNIGRS
jgi:hypothetical protein